MRAPCSTYRFGSEMTSRPPWSRRRLPSPSRKSQSQRPTPQDRRCRLQPCRCAIPAVSHVGRRLCAIQIEAIQHTGSELRRSLRHSRQQGRTMHLHRRPGSSPILSATRQDPLGERPDSRPTVASSTFGVENTENNREFLDN